MKTLHTILIVVGVAIVAIFLLKKFGIIKSEGFSDTDSEDGDLPEPREQIDTTVQDDAQKSVDVQNTNVLNYAQPSNPFELNKGAQATISGVSPMSTPYTPPGSCYPMDEIRPEDLLPEKSINPWSETSPDASMQNFLESAHHFSINTVGQSLKNANLQIRSDPPIPKVTVSPWMNSTITNDSSHRFFEIGSNYSA